MNQDFIFIGDPGPYASAMANALNSAGLSPKRVRIKDGTDLKKVLGKQQPAGIVFDSDMDDRAQHITRLRESPSLNEVPFFVRVPNPDPTELASAFCDGVDDYIVDGSKHQFSALVSAIRKEENWKAVRAPVGQVILAHPDRTQRIRLSSVLRRNGYDTHFAGTLDELETAIEKVDARAVLVSVELGYQEVVDRVNQATDPREPEAGVMPWILIAPEERLDELGASMPVNPPVKLFEASADAQGLTFLMNELLAPPPVGVRRSPRVLYGSPITFVPIDGTHQFFGFTFNINLGGLYIRTLTSFPLQTKIEVSFSPPFGRGQVVATAQVVWRKQLGDTDGNASPAGMGLQFLDLWHADRAGYEAGYGMLLEQEQAKDASLLPTPTA